MTLYTPVQRLDYRATAVIDTSEPMTQMLENLAKVWPEYQPVRHTSYGTYGIVRDDEPANVPHTFNGKPGRVCLGPEYEAWVSVVWNPSGAFPLRAWAPASLLKTCGRRW